MEKETKLDMWERSVTADAEHLAVEIRRWLSEGDEPISSTSIRSVLLDILSGRYDHDRPLIGDDEFNVRIARVARKVVPDPTEPDSTPNDVKHGGK